MQIALLPVCPANLYPVWHVSFLRQLLGAKSPDCISEPWSSWPILTPLAKGWNLGQSAPGRATGVRIRVPCSHPGFQSRQLPVPESCLCFLSSLPPCREILSLSILLSTTPSFQRARPALSESHLLCTSSRPLCFLHPQPPQLVLHIFRSAASHCSLALFSFPLPTSPAVQAQRLRGSYVGPGNPGGEDSGVGVEAICQI